MQAIIDLLKSLVNGIVGLIEFITNMVDDLIYFINLLGQLLPALPSFFTWLPPVAVSVLLTVFSIVVVLRVLGR